MNNEKNYTEWFEKMVKLLDNARKQGHIIVRIEDLENTFPELKESEDEKVRKTLYEYFKECKNDGDVDETWHGISYDKILSWLEKQGEKKEINLVEILKHYPKETELYSPLYGKLWLAEVDEKNEIITCYKHPLYKGCTRAVLEQEDTVSFYSNGTTGLSDFNVSKDCMLFLYDIEKQGEPIDEEKVLIGARKDVALSIMNFLDKCTLGMCLSNMECKDLESAVIDSDWSKVYDYMKKKLEKQGEQKPTDKFEPKFKVGDWIVFNGFVLFIKEVVQGYYRTITLNGIPNSYDWDIDKVARHWTIQDAKDGDVLSYVTDEGGLWIMIYWCLYEHYEGHVHYHALLVNDNFSDKGTCCICIDNLKPATKEQRDQLEKAMANAGYTFDFEKKELKKIENKIEIPFGTKDSELQKGEKPVAWSEEDDRVKKNCIHFLELQKQHHAATFEIEECIAWLERRGEQKPTDKSESKFKVGDWIVQDGIGLYKVIEICKYWYEVIDGEDNHYSISFDKEYMCHFWDIIKDAKDGDVLATPNYIYIFNSIDKETETVAYYCLMKKSNEHFSFGDYRIHDEILNSIPATKEQRDLLFQKMKESGYGWDAEKKKVLTTVDKIITPKDVE